MTMETNDERAKPCAARLDHGGWCVLEDGHIGSHLGFARTDKPDRPTVGPEPEHQRGDAA